MKNTKSCLECGEKESNLFDKIYLENLKERRIILNDEIDDHLYETVVAQIHKFNLEDEKAGIKPTDRTPIKLFVNSVGGGVYSGFAIVNAIVTSKTPIETYVEGFAMSMGLIIAAAGHKRYASPFSTFMYHEISTMAFGRNTDIEDTTAENRRLQKMYDSLILKQTNAPEDKLTETKKWKKDWFFGAEDALEMGFIHEIIQ